MDYSGDALLREMRASGLGEKAFWRERYQGQMTYNAFHSKVYRAGLTGGVRVIQLDTPTVEPEPALPTLDDLNDREHWRKNITELWNSQDTITVMHPSDRHEPYKDEIADEGVYALMSLVKPDVVVRGSDEEDNPTISYFIEEGSDEPDPGDFLDCMYQTRRYHTRRTQKIVPNALQVTLRPIMVTRGSFGLSTNTLRLPSRHCYGAMSITCGVMVRYRGLAGRNRYGLRIALW